MDVRAALRLHPDRHGVCSPAEARSSLPRARRGAQMHGVRSQVGRRMAALGHVEMLDWRGGRRMWEGEVAKILRLQARTPDAARAWHQPADSTLTAIWWPTPATSSAGSRCAPGSVLFARPRHGERFVEGAAGGDRCVADRRHTLSGGVQSSSQRGIRKRPAAFIAGPRFGFQSAAAS